MRAVAIKPPMWEAFEGREFKADHALDDLRDQVIATHGELAFLRQYDLTVLWKREGGDKAGKCKLVSRELRYWCDSDWLIWLAADKVREAEWGPDQIEALLFHELLHCALGGREEDKPAVRRHDNELFVLEIPRYGLWRDDYIPLAREMHQITLPGFEVTPDAKATIERGLIAATRAIHTHLSTDTGALVREAEEGLHAALQALRGETR